MCGFDVHEVLSKFVIRPLFTNTDLHERSIYKLYVSVRNMCMSLCKQAPKRACVRACVHACVRACVRAGMCIVSVACVRTHVCACQWLCGRIYAYIDDVRVFE